MLTHVCQNPQCGKEFKHRGDSKNLYCSQNCARLYKPAAIRETWKKKLKIEIDAYNKNPNICAGCNGILLFESRNNKFCSSSCSAIFNNKQRSKTYDKINININRYSKLSILKRQYLKTSSEITAKIPTFDELSWEAKRKIVILEQQNKCSRCGIDDWLGKQLSLEVDHIDGDRSNNKRDNLEALCPNCHSLTPTFRGKNRNKNIKPISDAELLFALQKHTNISKALRSVGMTPKGGNYKRCYRLLHKI